jgi:hypothetical protein
MNPTQDAHWKKVEGWRRYSVSDSGSVRNDLTGRILKPAYRSGYLYVVLCGDGGKRHKSAAVHRLVALAFLGPPNRPTEEVNHINGLKSDNAAANLEWVTRSENLRKAADQGLKPCGDRSHLCTKLSPELVTNIRRLYASGNLSQRHLGEIFGISQTYVGKLVHKQKWRQLK